MLAESPALLFSATPHNKFCRRPSRVMKYRPLEEPPRFGLNWLYKEQAAAEGFGGADAIK
jgi:hypothetical protein